jgi:DUF1680 family protein
MYAGMTDIAAIYHDTAYLSAVNKLWENMINKKMYITGGVGARHEGESFGDNYELPNLTAYNETCAAIGSVYWNHRLFLLSGNPKYYDIIERTLYNGLIAGISLDGNRFFYPNPLASDGNYAFNMGACTRQPWFDCSCCPTNMIRFVPSIPGLIYATRGDSLYVNLFMSNKAHVKIDGETVEINQQTNYPWDGKVNILVNPEKRKTFTMKVRIPGWAINEPVPGTLYSYDSKMNGGLTATMNGKSINFKPGKGYIEITNNWNRGDRIELTLPMTIRRVIADVKVKDDQGLVALEYGPLVYCAEAVDNNNQLPEINISDKSELKVYWRNDILKGVNIITGKVSEKKKKGEDWNDFNLVMVPYYAWSNRGIGKMNVWFTRRIKD